MSVDLTHEQREEMRRQEDVSANASQGGWVLWFLCDKCNVLHQWLGGPLRCYDLDKKEDN